MLRVPEVAERLGVDPTTVYRLAKTGRLPAIQLRKNGTVRIDEAELDALALRAGRGRMTWVSEEPVHARTAEALSSGQIRYYPM